jgi:hypothetical protein
MMPLNFPTARSCRAVAKPDFYETVSNVKSGAKGHVRRETHKFRASAPSPLQVKDTPPIVNREIAQTFPRNRSDPSAPERNANKINRVANAPPFRPPSSDVDGEMRNVGFGAETDATTTLMLREGYTLCALADPSTQAKQRSAVNTYRGNAISILLSLSHCCSRRVHCGVVVPSSYSAIFHSRARGNGQSSAAKGLADPLIRLRRIHVVGESRLVLERFGENR